MTREAALTCGKSIPIGTDPFGRSYWVFSADPTSLFICEGDFNPGASSDLRHMHRFLKPEEIASIMVCLGRDPLCESLKEVFPEASKLVNERTWSTLLMGRCLLRDPEVADKSPTSDEPKIDEEEQIDYGAVSVNSYLASKSLSKCLLDLLPFLFSHLSKTKTFLSSQQKENFSGTLSLQMYPKILRLIRLMGTLFTIRIGVVDSISGLPLIGLSNPTKSTWRYR